MGPVPPLISRDHGFSITLVGKGFLQGQIIPIARIDFVMMPWDIYCMAFAV